MGGNTGRSSDVGVVGAVAATVGVLKGTAYDLSQV
jgi:hypothetical protein